MASSGSAGNFQSIPALRPDQVPIPITPGSVNMYMNLDANLSIWTVDHFKVHRPIFVPPGSSMPQLLANAIFVDSQFGDNTNAQKSSLMDSSTNPTNHKFKTIAAARSAAVSGDVIIVYPGTYTNDGNLWKDGVTYYFYPNTTITMGYFRNTTAGQSCSVYGSGQFRVNIASNAICPVWVSDGTFHIECYSLYKYSGLGAVQVDGSGVIKVFAKNIKSEYNAAINIAASTTTCNAYIESETIENNTVFATSNPTINASTHNFRGYVKIKANRILGSSVNSAQIVQLTNKAVALADNTTIDIEGNIVARVAGRNGTACISMIDGMYMTYKITGNIYAKDLDAFMINGSNALGSGNVNMRYKGDIYTTYRIADLITFFWFGGINLYLSGKFFSSIGAGLEAIRLNGSAPHKLTIDGELKTSTAGAIGVGKLTASSKVIVDTLKIVTNASTSITAPAPDTIKVIYSLAVNNAPINITNSIVGSVFYTDAGVE